MHGSFRVGFARLLDGGEFEPTRSDPNGFPRVGAAVGTLDLAGHLAEIGARLKEGRKLLFVFGADVERTVCPWLAAQCARHHLRLRAVLAIRGRARQAQIVMHPRAAASHALHRTGAEDEHVAAVRVVGIVRRGEQLARALAANPVLTQQQCAGGEPPVV